MTQPHPDLWHYRAPRRTRNVAITIRNVTSGIYQNSTDLTKAAGWFVMGFAALGVYLFFSAASHVTGGRELPLGKPLLHT